jgi:hypothetical protein
MLLPCSRNARSNRAKSISRSFGRVIHGIGSFKMGAHCGSFVGSFFVHVSSSGLRSFRSVVPDSIVLSCSRLLRLPPSSHTSASSSKARPRSEDTHLWPSVTPRRGPHLPRTRTRDFLLLGQSESIPPYTARITIRIPISAREPRPPRAGSHLIQQSFDALARCINSRVF